MIKNIAKYVLIELLILFTILLVTKADVVFHLLDSIELTPKLIQKISNLQYDRYYKITHNMRYRIPIESQDKTKKSSLIWPQEPFGAFLILTSQDLDPTEKTITFSGKLVRCIYQCQPNDMFIEMFSFVESLETKYPQYKGKYKMLPSLVINTYDKPSGLKGYINATRHFWTGYAFALVVGGLLLIKSILKHNKPPSRKKRPS